MIAVLGGTGYVGRRLISALNTEGIQTLCIHRESSNLSCFDQNNNYFCTSDEASVEKSFEKNDISCVINASCAYEIQGVPQDALLEANLQVPLRILNCAIQAGIPRFVSIGTGLPKFLNIYALTKTHMNEYGRYFSEKGKISYVHLAMQNFYGPGEPQARFVPSTILKLKQNLPIDLTAGTQHRDYIYIDDVIRVILHAVDMDTPDPYIELPVGTGVAPTIRELVEFLASELNSKSVLNFGAIPMRPNELDQAADCSMINALGLSPRWDWKAGMREMLQFY